MWLFEMCEIVCGMGGAWVGLAAPTPQSSDRPTKTQHNKPANPSHAPTNQTQTQQTNQPTHHTCPSEPQTSQVMASSGEGHAWVKVLPSAQAETPWFQEKQVLEAWVVALFGAWGLFYVLCTA